MPPVAWLQIFLLRLLNRLAADTACRLGGTLGVLAWRIGVRRRLASRQVTDCLGLRGPARARVVRRSYASMGAQFVQVWTAGGPDGPERHAVVLNPRWIDLQVRRHPSAVFLSSHHGDWDMAGHGMTRHIPEVIVYAKAQHNPAMDELLNAQRWRFGVKVLMVGSADRSTGVQALRALRRRTALGIMADQRPWEGSPVWYLGQPTLGFDGPAFFAHKAGVPIIPGFAVRRRAGVSQLFVGRPYLTTGDRVRDTQHVMDLLGAMVLAAPGQYFWQHRRFVGTRPELPPRAVEPWRTRGVRLLADQQA